FYRTSARPSRAPFPASGPDTRTMSETPRGGRSHEPPRPQYRPDAGEPALRRQNPVRRRVPLAGGARQEALPHAWRRGGIRRAKGQPERAQARAVHGRGGRRAKANPGRAGGGTEVAVVLRSVTLNVRLSASSDARADVAGGRRRTKRRVSSDRLAS